MDAVAQIAMMVREAEGHADDTSKDRLRAIEYYQGEMRDTPADKGRSQMVSRDLRAHVKKVLPSLMRVLLGGARLVEFMPVGPGDEEGASQATDFVNDVVIAEADVYSAIEDVLHDALTVRNGILRWWFEEKQVVSVSRHTGLTDDALAELVSGDEVQVLEHSAREEMTDMGPLQVHDVKIKRMRLQKRFRSAAVPRERFLISPSAVDLDDSPLVGEVCEMRRSDLIAMGYDRETVMGLQLSGDRDDEQEARRDEYRERDETHAANALVDYYDLYIRFDMDGDGIAELRHVVFAGALVERNMLVNDECDEVQYCDVKTMSQPHQWEGISLADDLMDLQRGKTVLLRSTLDNIYWSNNPQPIFQDGVVLNEDAVYTPEFGLPIKVREGTDVRAAMGFNQVPFVADKSFAMMEYLDQEAADRTGVNDASSGLAPDALQNMTAKASAMIEQGGIGQTELMVRTAARGLRRFFQGLLRLVIRHQDVPRTVRLRDEWVEFDPRHWNAEMDCAINTGLGAGTRERDMAMMQQVMMLQEKMLAGFGPDNPFVKPQNLYNALAKMCEAAGLKTPDMYFTEPDEAEVQAKMDAMKNAPNPEQMKIEAQMKLEQAKMQAQGQIKQAELQGQMQLEQAKLAASAEAEVIKSQASTQKETAQMEADLQVKAAERDTQMQLAAMDLAFKRQELDAKMRLEYAKLGQQVGADGKPVDGNAQALQAMMQQMSKPKRVIRDEAGEIVGVETYDPVVN